MEECVVEKVEHRELPKVDIDPGEDLPFANRPALQAAFGVIVNGRVVLEAKRDAGILRLFAHPAEVPQKIARRSNRSSSGYCGGPLRRIARPGVGEGPRRREH